MGKTRSRPAVGAAGQAGAGADLTGHFSHNHSTPARQKKQVICVSDLLNRGQENAIPRRHLEAITGLDGRTIRLQIERERRGGSPILSDNQTGYFLPSSAEEVMRCVRSLRHRANEILNTAEAIEQAGG